MIKIVLSGRRACCLNLLVIVVSDSPTCGPLTGDRQSASITVAFYYNVLIYVSRVNEM